jgi:hypothetical protein
MKASVALNTRSLKPRQKLAKLQTAITKLTGNADMTNPNPTLASAQAKHDLAVAKLDALDIKEADLKTSRIDAAAAVDDAMYDYGQLGKFVDNKAAGNGSKITNAGYDVAATSAPIGAIGQVMDLVLTEGDHTGTLDFMCKPEKGASLYEVWTSPDPMTESSWVFATTSPRSSGTLKSLVSGSKTWVRMRAKGAAAEPGEWSDPAVKVVP